ncbi:MAG TPA: molecular chaperone DnaJ [Candidatus Magasanikbacteria bacterium]|nr:molecular chaperone DnaJ [Candidatus Magasanikbacteria bacterium]
MSKDYYKILGVEKSAGQDEIRAAFRKQAHQYHPDKQGGNAEKFKEINEAFQVLNDPQKRSQYDQFGSTFDQAGMGGGAGGFGGFNGFNAQGFDFSDLGDIFGGFGDIFGGGRASNRKAARGQDIQVDVQIDLKEAAFGTEKTFKLYKNSACDVCGGNGVEPGSKMNKCKDCGGKGQIPHVQRTVFGAFQSVADCPVCEGNGEIPEKKCRQCGGRGIIKKQEEIKVRVPAGIDDGESIRLTSKGEAGAKGSRAGDLYLRIRVKKDTRFRRDNFDLYTKKNISFTEAALGATVEVESLDGLLKVVIPEGVQSGQMIRLKSKGITHLRDSGRGDLFVEVVVLTPTKLSRHQKDLLRELEK